jgi:hypothetical protein
MLSAHFLNITSSTFVPVKSMLTVDQFGENANDARSAEIIYCDQHRVA